jgi:restriction system protein
MASKQVEQGFFFTSGEFYKLAKQFCEKENIKTISGTDLLSTIKALPDGTQSEILNEILATDYTAHICVRCGIKMVRRVNPTTGEEFWGCINFPRCRNIIHIRKTKHLKR